MKVVKETGGSGAMVSDEEILDAIQLLASTEGIFTEPAGGTTLAATRALISRGVIKPNESVVVCITGNGYKTAEVMADRVEQPVRIGRGARRLRAGRRAAGPVWLVAESARDRYVSGLPQLDGRRVAAGGRRAGRGGEAGRDCSRRAPT